MSWNALVRLEQASRVDVVVTSVECEAEGCGLVDETAEVEVAAGDSAGWWACPSCGSEREVEVDDDEPNDPEPEEPWGWEP